MARWRCPIVWEPAQLRGVQDGCNHKLILLAGMVLVLGINNLLEVEDAVGDAGEVTTLQQVIDTRHQKNSHRPRVLPIVDLVGVGQNGDGSARNGIPVNMKEVRGARDIRLSGHVKFVQLAGPQAKIQARIRPSRMVHLAGGAHVAPVALGPLNTLGDPHLNC